MEANQLTAEELAAIRERESKATPGPWAWWIRGSSKSLRDAADGDAAVIFGCHGGVSCNSQDEAFIAAARTDIPRLLATVEALRAENERLRAALCKINNSLVSLQDREGYLRQDSVFEILMENQA